MKRDKKVFLCVQSLLNISKDLRNEYEEYTNMLLFIADKIAEAEQSREKEDTTFTLHGNGEIHDLGDGLTGKDLTCGEEECEFVLEPTEDMKIEKEINEMISVVRKEMGSVSD